MNKLRRVTEAEVIAQFLRNEFHHQDFDPDRSQFAGLVSQPDLSDSEENALRRALFYRRRGHLWNEIPPDTAWWLVRLDDTDLHRLCIFARTHWSKIAGGNSLLSSVVDEIRTQDFRGVRVLGGTAHGGVEFSDVGKKVEAIRAFSQQLSRRADSSAVVLIGVDDVRPVTILEGNHRFAAALLVSPELLKNQFTVYFGVSPSMSQCCWYRTNLPNLLRYARNRLKNLWGPGASIQALTVPAAGQAGQAAGKPAAAGKAATESE